MTKRNSARTHRNSRSRIARAAQQGMTLIEIMIVVIIMAMIATGVGVAVLPKLAAAKEDQARTDGATVRTAVELFIAGGGKGCPSIEDLRESGELRKGTATDDPWGKTYEIECKGSDIKVTSAGADEQFGTEDDIIAE